MECKMMYSEPMLKLKADLVEGLDALHSGRKIDRARGLLKAYKAMQLLPEPTKENTSLTNTHLLIDLRDEFFRWEDHPGRNRIFRAIWKFVIWMYELDAYYRDRIDFLLEKWRSISGRWVTRAHNKPRMTHWREFDEERAKRMAEKERQNRARREVVEVEPKK